MRGNDQSDVQTLIVQIFKVNVSRPLDKLPADKNLSLLKRSLISGAIPMQRLAPGQFNHGFWLDISTINAPRLHCRSLISEAIAYLSERVCVCSFLPNDVMNSEL